MENLSSSWKMSPIRSQAEAWQCDADDLRQAAAAEFGAGGVQVVGDAVRVEHDHVAGLRLET